MPIVIGIRFKDSGKIYHFDPRDIALASGDWAIVETVRGPELGRVAGGTTELAQDQVIGELKPVLRRATQGDIDSLEQLREREPEALTTCEQKVVEHSLPMNLIKAEYNFDGSRLTFFFTAEKRVDFRALVRDLARTFRTRIELRQVGPRDEAKLLGGIGPCGRALCCSTFLPDFARVSIKMAKDQDLPLNPSKISGVCGRLLCCLSYEHEQYLEIKSELPQRGDWVQTAEGPGEVIAVNVVRENVTVQLGDGSTVDCSAAQIREVSQRVAAEAQSRNAEGVTPVARARNAGIDLHPEMDEDSLHALEEDDHGARRSPPRPQPERRPSTIRPDVALGASLTQRQRVQPPGERVVPPSSDPPVDVVDESEARGESPSKRVKRHRLPSPQRPGGSPPSAQQASSAPQPGAQPDQPSGGPEQASRRRKRNRGRGGKH